MGPALKLSVIVGGSSLAVDAAKKATTEIPIVFVVGTDPSSTGLVSSINQPGGNVTGVSFYDIPVTGKRLALLRELVPKAETIAVLQDPNSPWFEAETSQIEAAARAVGQKFFIVKAANEQEIDAAFSTVAKSGAGALLVGGGPFFNNRRSRLVGLAALHASPASYVISGFVSAGGWSAMGRARQTPIVVQASMSPAFSKARNLEIFRWSCRQSSSLQSISGPRERLVSRCRRHYWRAEVSIEALPATQRTLPPFQRRRCTMLLSWPRGGR